MDKKEYIKNIKYKKRRRKKFRAAIIILCVVFGLSYLTSIAHSKINSANAYENKIGQQLPPVTDKTINKNSLPDKPLSEKKLSAKTSQIPKTGSPSAPDSAEKKLSEKDNAIDDGTENSIEDSASSDTYEFGTPLPEKEAVESEYFDDAVFVGNSHTEGILSYSSMGNATVFASKGITIDALDTKPVIKTSSGRITIADALSSSKFGKVYILLGANELGWVYPSEFIKHYANFIDKIRELNPDALIYVQSIFPVTAEKDSKGTVYNNTNIKSYNKLIMAMAKEKKVYYLNVSEAVADENGNLPEDSSKDGMHFGKKYYDKWFDYLKTHTSDNITKEEP